MQLENKCSTLSVACTDVPRAMNSPTKRAIILRGVIPFITVLLSTPCISAQKDGPASDAELALITERGRMLAAYDVAAWHATNAVQAMNPAEGSVTRYLARKTASGWQVAFGRLSQSQDRFLIAYEAAQGGSPQEFKARQCDPPLEDTALFLFAARAVDTALADFKAEPRPYNSAVLPAKANQLVVYVYPAQTTDGVYPLGGDARYVISPDGKTIVEKRQLHKSIIHSNAPGEALKTEAGYHTHVLSDRPEDTDVFYVLSRKPSVPEYITSKYYFYCVRPDGSITYVGETSKVLGKK